MDVMNVQMENKLCKIKIFRWCNMLILAYRNLLLRRHLQGTLLLTIMPWVRKMLVRCCLSFRMDMYPIVRGHRVISKILHWQGVRHHIQVLDLTVFQDPTRGPLMPSETFKPATQKPYASNANQHMILVLILSNTITLSSHKMLTLVFRQACSVLQRHLQEIQVLTIIQLV